MSRNSLRKLAAAGMGAALIGSGLTVGLGAGVASAAPACAQSQSVTSKWAGSLGTPYTLSKEVLGDGTAAPGQTVTYSTKVTGSGALVNEISDYAPAGFELVSARLNVKWVVGGQEWEDITDTIQRDGNAYRAKGGGWTTAGGATIALETTYKVPRDAVIGSQIDSGAATNIVLAAGWWKIDPMGVCVTIREPNAVEAAGGSLDAAGLGSVNAGSGPFFGSFTDPQGSMTNVISGVLGNVLGNMS